MPTLHIVDCRVIIAQGFYGTVSYLYIHGVGVLLSERQAVLSPTCGMAHSSSSDRGFAVQGWRPISAEKTGLVSMEVSRQNLGGLLPRLAFMTAAHIYSHLYIIISCQRMWSRKVPGIVFFSFLGGRGEETTLFSIEEKSILPQRFYSFTFKIR